LQGVLNKFNPTPGWKIAILWVKQPTSFNTGDNKDEIMNINIFNNDFYVRKPEAGRIQINLLFEIEQY
jgi:hypothetical protein